MADKLQGDAHMKAIAGVSGRGWTHDAERDAISKTFQFKDFSEAFGWMTRVAMVAEQMNHHPEWSNVYRNVEVTLTTHDVDGLSDLDVTMAQKMDAFAD
ncbi:4a-hydroxytetrahydrobiopterin dehydratase [Gymnodinialimonas sp. 2305UL16-5]|uniref:4a-hydroxytetrahydrobiopterin dehydratase n=1 Tax=Gymnodinialimonas mytili TaxID=3126503 RepID=UPI0030ACA1D0